MQTIIKRLWDGKLPGYDKKIDINAGMVGQVVKQRYAES